MCVTLFLIPTDLPHLFHSSLLSLNSQLVIILKAEGIPVNERGETIEMREKNRATKTYDI